MRSGALRLSVAHGVMVLFVGGILQASTVAASVISTTDDAQIDAFQSGQTVLGFDEIVVPPGLCFTPLDRNQYAALGIVISATADGSDETHLARLPGCGNFGATGTHTPPNIIGGGTAPSSTGWRETVRFDFPVPASA
jgi:hypothetical protein